MTPPDLDPIGMLRPKRTITGYSAVLLPHLDYGYIDWNGFRAHVERTAAAGLVPAVNMDTGYGNQLLSRERETALDLAKETLGGRPFAAGAGVTDQPGDGFDREGYKRSVAAVVARGGTPVVVQSHGLTGLPDAELVAAYADLGHDTDGFIGFELGAMFAPFGKIYSLDIFRDLLGVDKCLGAKHSSLSRDQEWQRLRLRDQLRPGFKVFTGNDLAIDMVMYGSDYLLGLSTFAPDLFAERDRYWAAGDPRFYELNDRLQYLGCFAFRDPVPAYKHSAAMFLKLRGWIGCDEPHPFSPTRPDADRAVLKGIADLLGV